MESMLFDDEEGGVTQMLWWWNKKNPSFKPSNSHHKHLPPSTRAPVRLSPAGMFVVVMMLVMLAQLTKFLYWPSGKYKKLRRLTLGQRFFVSRWQLITIFFAVSGLATTQLAVRGGLLSLPEEVMQEQWFIEIIRPPVVCAFFAICGVNTLVSIQALLCCSGKHLNDAVTTSPSNHYRRFLYGFTIWGLAGFVKWKYAHWFNESRWIVRAQEVGITKFSWSAVEKLTMLGIQWYIFLAAYAALFLSLLPLFASVLVLLATDVPWTIYTKQLYPRLSKGMLGSIVTSRIEGYMEQHEVLRTAITFQTTIFPSAVWSVICQLNVLLYSWTAYLRVTEQLEGNDTLLGLLEELYGVSSWYELSEPIKKSASVNALHRVLSQRVIVPIKKSVSEMNLFRLSHPITTTNPSRNTSNTTRSPPAGGHYPFETSSSSPSSPSRSPLRRQGINELGGGGGSSPSSPSRSPLRRQGVNELGRGGEIRL